MSTTPPEVPARPAPSRAWRRASRGMVVIGMGLFLLLNTTGALPWSFWLDLMAFWPVALVALGVRLIFDRSRLPAAVLLSPLIILSTMTWVAARGPNPHRAVGRHVTLAAARPADIERWTLDGRVSYGELDIRPSLDITGALLSGEAVAARTSNPVRLYAGDDSARVRLGETGSVNIVAIGVPLTRWSIWDVEIASDLPVRIDLELALADSTIDLVGVPVSSVDVEGAFNDVELRLGAPASDVRIALDGAFNRFTLIVPESVPVRFYTEGFLNLTDGSTRGTGPGYRVRVDGAFNQFDVERR